MIPMEDFSEIICQDSETNEEESAYNEHFKHSELRSGSGVSTDNIFLFVFKNINTKSWHWGEHCQ